MRLSNRGTDEAGPNFVLGQVMVNGLLGGQTNLGATFGATTDYEEYNGLGLLANVGVGVVGGRSLFSGFRSRSESSIELIVDRDDDYLRDRASGSCSRGRCRFSSGRARPLAAALDLDDLEIVRSGGRLRDERLRMLPVRAPCWSWRDSRAANTLSSASSLCKGSTRWAAVFSALDIADHPRRADFTFCLCLTFTRVSQFGEGWSLRLDALGQQTPHTLPYGERFKIGGDRLGRGFEAAEIAGDQGIGAKVELRRSLANTAAHPCAARRCTASTTSARRSSMMRRAANRPRLQASVSRLRPAVFRARHRARETVHESPTSKAARTSRCSPSSRSVFSGTPALLLPTCRSALTLRGTRCAME